MNHALLNLARQKAWILVLFCSLPILVYFTVFWVLMLNINYVAFDDILILGVIPGFDDASWPDRWHRLTELFPEHRLVFSRSVILLFYKLFGKVNLTWLMIIANLCWVACAFIFYRAFRKTSFSLWYFVPVTWLWFNIQSYENMFWGVSSLCNFGVLLFSFAALYIASFRPHQYIFALLSSVLATFTYGNGLLVFPVIGLLSWLAGRKKAFVATILVMAIIAVIYFIDFTPNTKNLDLTNWGQVQEGIAGYFGFIGSIATIAAYDGRPNVLLTAVVTGFIFFGAFVYLYRKQWVKLWKAFWVKEPYTNATALFALGIILFVAVTTLALVYKRIPNDSFQGMFKGRYRMYSTLWCIALYFGFLALSQRKTVQNVIVFIITGSIILNLAILDKNFVLALNNRRAAIAQEFNARYNSDWLGLRMFDMEQKKFELIRAYYNSEDALAEGWNVKNLSASVQCDQNIEPERIEQKGDLLTLNFQNIPFEVEKDYSDGAYAILKSDKHTYVAGQEQFVVPVKTSLRRQMYFTKDTYFSFHRATIEPDAYNIYLLVRKGGVNKIYCTGKIWSEK